MTEPAIADLAASLDPLTRLAARALAGDATALEDICRELQDPLYGLAMRVFSHPDDAADATQEALVTIVTKLASFRGQSKLTTWAYTVASRQFLRVRRARMEDLVAGPEQFGRWIDEHRAEPSAEALSSAEFDELCGDVRIACTYGMLTCLSRPSRLAYLLGDVIGMTDKEGAEACGISPAAFRQRLARSRRTMRDLMAERCGLVNEENPCRCAQLVEPSIEAGVLDPDNPHFARHRGVEVAIESDTIEAAANELDTAVAIGEVFRSDPAFRAPSAVMDALSRALPTLT